MTRRIAIKKLTESDLTIFKYHHYRTAGKQKAINLNADVFVEELYPELPEFARSRNGRFPLDLHIYGPGFSGEYNLQRKILKSDSYKNWRLDGEFIDDPIGETGRFDQLSPDDFAVMEFFGDGFPRECKMVLICRQQDTELHASLERAVATSRMIRINEAQLTHLTSSSNLSIEHPIFELLVDAALEDAAFFGTTGTQDLLKNKRIRKLSRQELDRARKRAEDSGFLGEEFVNAYLSWRQKTGEIDSLEWSANENAISPFDFVFQESGKKVEVDAKSTRGEFSRKIHISFNELHRMANTTSRYDLYRVYNMEDAIAKMRIASDLQNFAKEILSAIANVPNNVTIDSVSISPEKLPFGPEVSLSLNELSEFDFESDF